MHVPHEPWASFGPKGTKLFTDAAKVLPQTVCIFPKRQAVNYHEENNDNNDKQCCPKIKDIGLLRGVCGVASGSRMDPKAEWINTDYKHGLEVLLCVKMSL